MSDTPTETIVRVAARGDGMTASGRAVPLTAPGDQVTPDGTILPGPHHQTPPCRHFPACGGCQLQHLDDETYADFATARVRDALAAQGLETELRAPHLSPPASRRRAALHVERRGRTVLIGFSAERSHRLIDLAECPILHPRLFALVEPIRGLLSRIMPARGRADLHLTLTDQGPDVLIKGFASAGLESALAITDFAEAHGLARLSLDEGFGPETRWEPDAVTITLSGVPVPMPAGSFLQATADGETALIAAALEAVSDARMITDLFAGLGTFAFAMAPGRRIYAAEAARDAVLAMKAGAGAAGIAIAADHRDLFRNPVSAADCGRFDAIILDPPRAGAREQVGQIAQSGAEIVSYISCNPSSFARDAKTLCEGGYRLDWVRPVGQFRWSTHVELASRFSRQG
ncbi:class I SAM-dependent RNA methyltransferase [Sphingomonas sp. BGYR3]|uniref:class I SAM-dependent RNA methyltransferase n=1 Tax=Sphingomonas sp. BGYR3 TaxID=2975483 RepID=UPI0021A2DD13|nr:class I SAM-dependent RNA methyltransferase [Sphingomonas sp. BGYR3]MDG5487361.1 class I SAM-dependent RNA methyltransferase [Sphingomonas sp. BGYR3]